VQWQGVVAFSYLKLAQAAATSEGQIGARHRGAWAGMDIAKAYA
jgi:hypothetical protein